MIKKNKLYYPSKEFKSIAVVKDNSFYKKGKQNPLKFWADLSKELFWHKPWKKVFEHKPPYFKWFIGGKINIVQNCLDQNLEKRKNKIALIWESEDIAERQRVFTYYDLYRQVNKFSNALKKLGVKKGDRVGIYLPMIPEVVIAILACARIGAVHSVVFSAFSASALRVRLEDTKAKVLITADGYYRRGSVINLKETADQALDNTSVKKVVVVERMKNKIKWVSKRDYWWHELVKDQKDYCLSEPMDSEDPLFILYTSGSTGKPKGILHTCGGYTVQSKFTGKWIFDLKEDDILWCTADVGWITGHTYGIYSPLLNGATFIMFEGAPDWPNPDRWCEVIEKYGVTTFYTAPTAIRMFKKYGTDLVLRYDFNTLQVLGVVGETIDEASWEWYFRVVGKKRCPIVDTWWQTETGGILISSLPGIGPFKPAFTGLPFPGVKFDILDDKGKGVPSNKQGNLVILPPFAPGMLRGVYKDEKKYLDTYWDQYGKKVYFTSDTALRDKNGLIRIVGRADDVIKVAGHRITTGELENTTAKHLDVAEAAVVGIPDEIKGEVPVIFIGLKKKREPAEIKLEIISGIKKEIGPIALPKEIYIVEDLPKTRSGKIMRRILRKLFTNEELGDLSTLANPESVAKIRKSLNL